MHITILGGDGYLGWPSSMYFSKRGYKVTIVDNYFRRNACNNLEIGLLYDVPSLTERAQIWYELTGLEIKVVICDLSVPFNMRKIFSDKLTYDWAIDHNYSGIPDTIIHYAEQPSAPYSMMDFQHANTTLLNNLSVTNNLLWAVRDFSPSTHIIKLGTMGEYGTPNIDIEEGWLEIKHKGRNDTFLFPRQAGSLYHTTKIMDTDLIWFAVRMWDLRVTDLMQGPVYGIETDESSIDERLNTIFNYDEIFGTIVNRFVSQAVTGYPLTVYGSGGQTRGYLNIKDVLQCVYMTERSPSKKGELRIFNQIMETFTVSELANLTKKVGDSLGFSVQIKSIPNPRTESENHYYNPSYQGLQDLGVKPHFLTENEMSNIFSIVNKYAHNINKELFIKGIKW
jgi:UDP-sulfoquinovose synthase